MRRQLVQARRLVVKIGSSSLTRPDGRLDLNRIDQVAAVLAQLTRAGKQVVLVSSGAVAAGLDPLGFDTRPRELPTVQACAAMGQGLLVARWAAGFQAHFRHVAQVLLTAEDVMRRDHYTNARQALDKLLNLGVIPVVNENDAVTTREVRFGDNDRLAAYVSHLVHADALVILTDVDGLYTAPPSHPQARRIVTVTDPAQLQEIQLEGAGSAVGTGGMRTKLRAALMAGDSGIDVVMCHADDLAAAARGQVVGTFFAATGKRRPSRSLWIAHAALSQGQILVDDGAARAITTGKKSLLLAGVVSARGSFQTGDVVEVHDGRGLFARGVCAYDSEDVNRWRGKSMGELKEAGHLDPRPVIHRDDLAQVPRL
ncbi:MAG: glutamate 5-kinase [Actinomycetaceae bacterium]|nr:glutamate 5-kinase [Actinomycetaceae bacterium]